MTIAIDLPPSVGQWAHATLSKSFQAILTQEALIRRDRDSTPIHRFRVSTRRLRSAIALISPSFPVPKSARLSPLIQVAKQLGPIRDIDVQLVNLQDIYLPQLPEKEQKRLNDWIQNLKQQRREHWNQVDSVLDDRAYRHWKKDLPPWLDQLNSQPLPTIADSFPELLYPALSQFFTAWWRADSSPIAAQPRHDLRKFGKQVRYQLEAVQPIYGESLQPWIQNFQELQGVLGQLQDLEVLQEWLTRLGDRKMPQLHSVIQTRETESLQQWESLRLHWQEQSVRSRLIQDLLVIPKL